LREREEQMYESKTQDSGGKDGDEEEEEVKNGENGGVIKVPQLEEMGIDVLRQHTGCNGRIMHKLSKHSMGEVKGGTKEVVISNLVVPAGETINIIPFLHKAGMTSSFVLRIFSRNELTMDEVPPFFSTSISSTWDGDSNGGPTNNPHTLRRNLTWCQNPQIHVKFPSSFHRGWLDMRVLLRPTQPSSNQHHGLHRQMSHQASSSKLDPQLQQSEPQDGGGGGEDAPPLGYGLTCVKVDLPQYREVLRKGSNDTKINAFGEMVYVRKNRSEKKENEGYDGSKDDSEEKGDGDDDESKYPDLKYFSRKEEWKGFSFLQYISIITNFIFMFLFFFIIAERTSSSHKICGLTVENMNRDEMSRGLLVLPHTTSNSSTNQPQSSHPFSIHIYTNVPAEVSLIPTGFKKVLSGSWTKESGYLFCVDEYFLLSFFFHVFYRRWFSFEQCNMEEESKVCLQTFKNFLCEIC